MAKIKNLGLWQIRSKELKTEKNHILLYANVEGPEEGRILEKAIKKAARVIRKTTGSRVSFEIYINNRKNSLLEE